MYKTIIVTDPFDQLKSIPRIVNEINERNEKIISFNIQAAHHDPTNNKNRYRSFIWIVEVPEPTESV